MIVNRLALAASFCLYGASAMAQTVSVPQVEGTDEGSYALGGAVLINPQYVGSDETRVLPLPYIDVRNYKGFDFTPFTVSYAAVDYLSGEGLWAWGVTAGPQASWEFGRDDDDGDELIGLEEIGSSIYLGGYSRIRLGPIGVRLEGGQDVIDGTGGAKFDASIGTRLPLAEGSLTAGYTFNWGSEEYVESFFGVSRLAAERSGFDAYAADGGIYANTATLLGQYPLKKNWELTALASYRQYKGDAEDSPIITAETGSSDGLTLVLGVSKRFGFTNR